MVVLEVERKQAKSRLESRVACLPLEMIGVFIGRSTKFRFCNGCEVITDQCR